MKKGVFTVMNYLMPQAGVLSMHCSANVGRAGDVSLFFGLSGTGKTTLSADPARRSSATTSTAGPTTVFSTLKGAAMPSASTSRPKHEPQIYNAIRFGAILENVIVDPQTRAIDYDSDFLTENTRATYPIEHIPNAVLGGSAIIRATSSS